jgi:hypothetical protein
LGWWGYNTPRNNSGIRGEEELSDLLPFGCFYYNQVAFGINVERFQVHNQLATTQTATVNQTEHTMFNVEKIQE